MTGVRTVATLIVTASFSTPRAAYPLPQPFSRANRKTNACGGYFAYLREKLSFTLPVDSCDADRQVWETR